MKQLLSYIFIVLGLAVLATATSRSLFAPITKAKMTSQWWGEHDSKQGDLTNMAYLEDVPQFRTPKDYQFKVPADSTGPHNINLYLWGDSYTEDIPGFVFAHVDSYFYAHSHHNNLVYNLDKSKRNILIIETTERFIKSRFTSLNIYKHLLSKNDEDSILSHPAKTAGSSNLFSIDELFNPLINQNIEYLVFNMNALSGPRLLKADVNYYLFHRGSGNVAVSADGERLFLKETMEPHGLYSAFEPTGDKMIKDCAATLTNMYYHYRADGFDEVYLSIIPSPASILQPENYNKLLPRLQQCSDLKIPFINLYSLYRQTPNPAIFYRAGDSHWCNTGLQAWLGLVNEELSRQSKMQTR